LTLRFTSLVLPGPFVKELVIKQVQARVALRVGVDEQHPSMRLRGEECCQVDGDGRLPDAPP
jgi:hypothetical protein